MHRFVRGDGMGYKIVYGTDSMQVASASESGGRLRLMTAACLLVFCMLVRCFWPEGTGLLREIILPGEPTATEQAFDRMLEDLRLGESLGDAVTVFCKDVIRQDIP